MNNHTKILFKRLKTEFWLQYFFFLYKKNIQFRFFWTRNILSYWVLNYTYFTLTYSCTIFLLYRWRKKKSLTLHQQMKRVSSRLNIFWFIYSHYHAKGKTIVLGLQKVSLQLALDFPRTALGKWKSWLVLTNSFSISTPADAVLFYKRGHSGTWDRMVSWYVC